MAITLIGYSSSIVLGLILGLAFVRLWRVCVPQGLSGRLFHDFRSIAGQLTKVDEIDLFFSLYKRLLLSVSRYVLRNLAGLCLACAPAVIVLAFLSPPLLDAWGAGAKNQAYYPEAVSSESLGDWIALQGKDTSHTTREASLRNTQSQQLANLSADDFDAPSLAAQGRRAFCWNWGYCALFHVLGFEVTETDEPILPNLSFVVVRPDLGDGNFLWPFLGDLEFVFYAAFLLATFGALFLPKRPA
jgi:hypothetical protein